jgi:hypothetical protein
MKNSPAYEDGTDSEFRNVGQKHTDAGDLPKRKQTRITLLIADPPHFLAIHLCCATSVFPLYFNCYLFIREHGFL